MTTKGKVSTIVNIVFIIITLIAFIAFIPFDAQTLMEEFQQSTEGNVGAEVAGGMIMALVSGIVLILIVSVLPLISLINVIFLIFSIKNIKRDNVSIRNMNIFLACMNVALIIGPIIKIITMTV